VAAVPGDTSPVATEHNTDSLVRALPMPTSLDTSLVREISTAHFSVRTPANVTIDTGTIHPEDPRGLRIRGPVMRDTSGDRGSGIRPRDQRIRESRTRAAQSLGG
jgi:hypothetical protein